VKYLHSGRLWPYPQTLELSEKACQIQMLQILTKIHKSVVMVLSVIMLSFVMLSVVTPSCSTECCDAESRYAEFRGTIVLCWSGDMKKKTLLTIL
jgi:hypothetical protein